MDITKELDSIIAQDEQGKVGIIYQPNDEPYLAPDGTPCTMTVLGSESARVRKATEAFQRKLSRTPGKKDNIVELMRIERAAAAVIEWHGWLTGAEPAACTPENIRTVCRAQHILVQIEGYRDRHADFFESSSSS